MVNNKHPNQGRICVTQTANRFTVWMSPDCSSCHVARKVGTNEKQGIAVCRKRLTLRCATQSLPCSCWSDICRLNTSWSTCCPVKFRQTTWSSAFLNIDSCQGADYGVRAETETNKHTAFEVIRVWQIQYPAVRWRIRFKLASLTYKALHIGHPPYLAELLQYHKPTRSTHSSASHSLSVPRHNLSFGSRAFRTSAPKIWNTLPPHILQSQTLF